MIDKIKYAAIGTGAGLLISFAVATWPVRMDVIQLSKSVLLGGFALSQTGSDCFLTREIRRRIKEAVRNRDAAQR